MIGGKSILGIIPARGGSKRVPRKNLREVGGRPLIAWTIEEARKSRYLDRVILSSEDPEIIRVAHNLHCEAPFVRPAELAKDDTSGIEPILHAIEQLPGYDYVVLLQPTSPLRIASDIDAAIADCHERHSPACVSVTECRENPVLMFRMSSDQTLTPLLPEGFLHLPGQHFPPFCKLNGAVYVASIPWFQTARSFIAAGTVGYSMPPERSLDIDSEEDLQQLVDFLALQKGNM